jgi:hypothetical protein
MPRLIVLMMRNILNKLVEKIKSHVQGGSNMTGTDFFCIINLYVYGLPCVHILFSLTVLLYRKLNEI